MIQAQSLPPNKSVYDYPIVLPGQELTEEQKRQAQLAQIAGIILATAAAKDGIEQATTNQLITLLRATDLTNRKAVEVFAKNAAQLVGLAIKATRDVTWAGVASRANVMGIPFASVIPPEEEIPTKLRYSRSTGLSSAYKRIADEYQENLKRTPEDPIIAELIRQFEAQNMTPVPRPDNISHDAFKEAINNDQEKDWEEIFSKAEETTQRKEESSVDAWATSPEAQQTLTETAGARGESKPKRDDGSQWAARDYRELFPDDADDISNEPEREESVDESGDASSTRAPEREDEGGREDGASTDAEDTEFRLTDREKRVVIEKYAQHKAEERAERMVSQDVASTSRNTHNVAINKMPDKKLSGFRRVVHPELSKSGSCGLCVVASTMRYTKRDLMPIHANCKCEVAEIYKFDDGTEFDPGHQINLEDLGAFYDAAGSDGIASTHGWDLKKGRYVIEDHPEYGPTLVSANTKKKFDSVLYTPSEYQRRYRED